MARSGLGDGTAGKATQIQIKDPMAIQTPAAKATQKAVQGMQQQQVQRASSAKSMKMSSGGGGTVDNAKAAMLPRQEQGDVAGAVNGVGAFIDGYLRINKRRYQAQRSKSPMMIGR